MNKQTLTFLGRDSGFGEKNNSAYFENNNNLFLIDCGLTVFQDLKCNFNLSKYSTISVIITHLHNDHAGSLSQLILYLWFVLKKKTHIITNCINIKQFLDITGTPSDSYELLTALPNLEFIKTEHTPYLDAYGFKLITDNKVIIYTGDTNTLSPFIPYMKDCNELYIDVSKFGGAHLKIDDILDDLNSFTKNGTEIYFMHMDDKEYIKKVTNNLYNYE